MKREFLDQIELLISAYEHVQGAERRKLESVMDHLTAVLYELLHSDLIEGAADLVLLTDPLSPRVLH